MHVRTGARAPLASLSLGLESASRLLITAVGILLGPKQGSRAGAVLPPRDPWQCQSFDGQDPGRGCSELWPMEARDAWENRITGPEYAGC